MRISPTRGIAACIVATGLGGAAAAAPPAGPALVKGADATLGRILVDSHGKTLYLFDRDRGGKSACYGGCATRWPPYLTAGRPRAGAGATASLLGTARRRDGSLQVTYGGHPLYAYGLDRKAGEAKGEALGGTWYAISPQGTKVEQAPASSGDGSYGGGSGSYGYGN